MQDVAKWQRLFSENMHQILVNLKVLELIIISQINPLVGQAMDEVGIDITNQKPKEITEDMIKNATKIINMGCMDKNFCPTFFIDKVVDWGIEDPKGKPIEKVREIRDEIKLRVRNIITDIEKERMMEQDN
jgi:arsenate reductase (thioredoxin)